MDRGNLYRLKDAIVEVAFEPGQGHECLRVAAHEPDPPAWHIVGLGKGKELDAHLLCARHLQEAGGLIAVEEEVGIGEVVDHEQVVLAREIHHAVEELQVHDRSRRVMGKAQQQQLRSGPALAHGLLQGSKEIFSRP